MTNACAGPFGAFYDTYIERPWLSRAIAALVWGIDVRPLYASIAGLDVHDGMTVVDVPSGGGLALRALPPGHDVRWIAVDLEPKMLERTRRRAAARGVEVETVDADMRALPLADREADLALCYSGLHMIDDPRPAITELLRILKPGGRLVGTSFTGDGGRRQRAIFPGSPPTGPELGAWLGEAGFTDVEVEGRGFVLFTARRG